MGIKQLTQRQINLLYVLVDHWQNGRLIEPFGLVPINASEYVIYVRQQSSMRLRHADDLDALCLNGYLEYSWNRLSNGKLYSVTKLARLAFKSGQLVMRAELTESVAPVVVANNHLSPENQEYMTLLAETNRVRMQLKREMTAVLYGTELGDAVAELTAVQDMYYMVRPETAVIAQTLHQIGSRLMAEFAAVDGVEDSLAVSQVLVTFGAWTRLIFQLLSL